MTATLVISLVIGGLLLLGVLSILGLAMNLVGGIFELVFGLLGLVLGSPTAATGSSPPRATTRTGPTT